MTVTPLFPSPNEASQSRFEECWKAWPNKAKKPLARARYEAVLKGLKTRTLDRDSGQFVELDLKATEDEILAGIKAYLKSQIDPKTYRFKDDGKYIPMLSVWINGGRWEDWK